MWTSRNGKWRYTRGQVSYLSLIFGLSESKCFINKSSTEFYSFVWVSFYFSLSISPKCQACWHFGCFQMVFDLKREEEDVWCANRYFIWFITYTHTILCLVHWLMVYLPSTLTIIASSCQHECILITLSLSYEYVSFLMDEIYRTKSFKMS